MPRVNESQQIDMTGWAPIESTEAQTPTNATDVDPSARDPLMHASMPLMASTNDALRQFYGNGNLPTHRTLPFRRGGAS